MKKIFLLLFTLISISLFAQKQTNNWYFGEDGGGITFNTTPPTALANGQLHTVEGTSTMSDSSGNLLFYTDGDTVWDKNNLPMPNGTGLWGHESSTQSALATPYPGSDTLFYIFTTDAGAGPHGFCYSIVDITKNAGAGDVIVKNVQLLTPTTEGQTAVKHGQNCNDIWLIVHDINSNAFYSYLVTNSGISAPVISNTGVVRDSTNFGGQIKISLDGKKLAIGNYTSSDSLQVFDFNDITGVISNPFSLSPSPNGIGVYGIAFSPDNSKLYTADLLDLWQYDLTAGSPAAIDASKDSIGQVNPAGMQIASDGKIYVISAMAAVLPPYYISVINDPNQLGLACNFVTNSIIVGSINIGSIPHFFEGYLTGYANTAALKANYIYNTTCLGNPVQFTDSSYTDPANWQWNFDDVASGTLNIDSAQNPAHLFSSAGNFNVTLIVSKNCATDTVTKTITINPLPIVDAGANVTITQGSSTTLNATGGTNCNWQPSAGLSDPAICNPIANPNTTTTYYVTVTDVNGCSNIDSITVTVVDEIKCNEIFIPTAFSPNGDGQNEMFYVRGNCIKDLSFSIYDRWGEKVFETSEATKGWDGKFKNKDLNTAILMYYLNATLLNGDKVTKKGNITLMR